MREGYPFDMIYLGENHKIVDAYIIVNDEQIHLEEKPQGNSGKVRCHFYTRKNDDFEVVFRMDWEDLDEYKNPCLDVNIKKNGKEYKDSSDEWHHTTKTFENSEYVYTWKVEQQDLKEFGITFKLQTTHQQSISGGASIIHDDNSSKVSKGQIKRSQKALEKLIGTLK